MSAVGRNNDEPISSKDGINDLVKLFFKGYALRQGTFNSRDHWNMVTEQQTEQHTEQYD